jgi:hypothetical protein
MPRIILKGPPRPPSYERLVKRLAQELTAPGKEVQPLILEQVIEATGSRHVHVIWDEWKGLSDEQRSAVILQAYAEVEGAKAAPEITLASGVTAEEALSLGLLPYKVVPMRKRHESEPPAAAYKKALKAEARQALVGTEALELRYARIEDAEEARKRLEKTLPGSHWAVVQEVASES